MATRGRKEEIIAIQFPNSTNLYLGSGTRAQGPSQDALKVAMTLKFTSLFTQE
jgi:hypothetical protein